MRVLWIPSWYPTADNPANGSFFAEQVDMLRTCDMDVRVAVTTSATIKQVEQQEALKLVPIPDGCSIAVPAIPRSIVPGDTAIARLAANKIAAFFDEQIWIPDVIHAHSVFPAILVTRQLARIWKVPFGITEHRPSTLRINPKGFRYKAIRDAVIKTAFRFTVSDDMASALTTFMIRNRLLPAACQLQVVFSIKTFTVDFPKNSPLVMFLLWIAISVP